MIHHDISCRCHFLVLCVVRWLWWDPCGSERSKSNEILLLVHLVVTQLTLHSRTSNHEQVLSAAHCERVVSSFVTLGMHKKVLNKAAGDDADEFSQLELIPIEHSEIHPKYNPVTLDYDFWIIKLQWPSQLYADKAVTIDSPTDSFILSSGNNLSLIGFGRLKAGGSSPNMLHEVTLDYMTNSDCIARGAISPPLTDAMLCAGTTVGKGACHVRILIFITTCTILAARI